jgi:putative transcriptional regulator
MPHHHPDESLLIEYAAGSLSEAKALLVATHLAMCPACRAGVRAGEAAGAALAFSDSEAVAVGPEPDVTAQAVERSKPAVSPPAPPLVPEPLRGYLGAAVSELPWVGVWRGMKAYALPEFEGRESVRLLSIEPNRRMPRHTHAGHELTLVLQGSFHDASGAFGKGDVAAADESVDHQPRAGADEVCLCLAVEDAPLKLTGFAGAVLSAAASVRGLRKR